VDLAAEKRSGMVILNAHAPSCLSAAGAYGLCL